MVAERKASVERGARPRCDVTCEIADPRSHVPFTEEQLHLLQAGYLFGGPVLMRLGLLRRKEGQKLEFDPYMVGEHVGIRGQSEAVLTIEIRNGALRAPP